MLLKFSSAFKLCKAVKTLVLVDNFKFHFATITQIQSSRQDLKLKELSTALGLNPSPTVPLIGEPYRKFFNFAMSKVIAKYFSEWVKSSPARALARAGDEAPQATYY